MIIKLIYLTNGVTDCVSVNVTILPSNLVTVGFAEPSNKDPTAAPAIIHTVYLYPLNVAPFDNHTAVQLYHSVQLHVIDITFISTTAFVCNFS